MHRSKCTPAEILSLPTVSIFRLVLLLLCLLLLLPANEFTHRAYFRFLMEQICHITLAVVHQHRIVFLTVGGWFFCGGTVTLRLHRNLLAGIWERRAEWMLTIEGLISVLGLCLTCFGLGYAIGSKDNNKPQK